MKKIVIFLASLVLLTGCGNNKMLNTPTKRVEMFFESYQSLDKNVIDQLNDVANNEISFTDSQRESYVDLMKKHYQALKYEIKDEVINGDTATVTVEITVMDYSNILKEANEYLENNKQEFNDENGKYDETSFNEYRLNKLKEADKTVTYTIDMTLTKIDGEWILDDVSNDVNDKIQGIYEH